MKVIKILLSRKVNYNKMVEPTSLNGCALTRQGADGQMKNRLCKIKCVMVGFTCVKTASYNFAASLLGVLRGVP